MVFTIEFWFTQLLHGLQYSSLLFLLSIGLTVIFGLLHFVNLAHGALYAMGAYLAYSFAQSTDSYWVAFFGAPLIVSMIGLFLYFTLIKKMRHQGPMNQVLVTFGLIFVFWDFIRLIWGDVDLGVSAPAVFSEPIEFFGITYSAYRLFVIALGLFVMAVLAFILKFTQIGAIIRASVDNQAMASALGINVEAVFIGVFALGCALAGLAGVVAVPILSANPAMGLSILIPTLIVVVIGGLGSLKGAVIGSLIVGFIETFGAVIVPDLAPILIYICLGAFMILRPQGLFPARQG